MDIVPVPIEQGLPYPPFIDAVDFVSWLHFKEINDTKVIDLTAIRMLVNNIDQGPIDPKFTVYANDLLNKHNSTSTKITQLLIFKHDDMLPEIIVDVNEDDIYTVRNVIRW